MKRVIIAPDTEVDDMFKNPIKKIKIFAAAMALCVAAQFTGCAGIMLPGGRAPELPANAQSFKTHGADSSSLTFIDVNGRTYASFGKLNGKLRNSSLQDCLGYVDNDKNDRIYSLNEEPFGNYLISKNASGIAGQTVIWRDFATYGEDIFTPEYIVSKDDVEWGRSGCYPEMKEFRIQIDLDADDVKEISMQYKVNGQDCGSAGVRNAVGGLKNPDGKLPMKRGEKLTLSISELSLYGKFDRDKLFDAECMFSVESVNGKNQELEYVYMGKVKLGDEEKLTLTGNAEDGYKLKKQV